jgi:hypothetical protein
MALLLSWSSCLCRIVGTLLVPKIRGVTLLHHCCSFLDLWKGLAQLKSMTPPSDAMRPCSDSRPVGRLLPRRAISNSTAPSNTTRHHHVAYPPHPLQPPSMDVDDVLPWQPRPSNSDRCCHRWWQSLLDNTTATTVPSLLCHTHPVLLHHRWYLCHRPPLPLMIGSVLTVVSHHPPHCQNSLHHRLLAPTLRHLIPS